MQHLITFLPAKDNLPAALINWGAVQLDDSNLDYYLKRTISWYEDAPKSRGRG